MAENKTSKIVRYIIYAALGVGAAWLVLEYALPWLLPFLIALVTARLLDRPVSRIAKALRVRREFASAVCAALLLAAVIALIVLLVWRASYELMSFVRSLPTLLAGASGVISSLEDRIYGLTVSAPPEIQEYIRNVLRSFSERSAALPTELSGRLLSFLSSIASRAPRLTLFSVTCAVAVFYLSANYSGITGFLSRQLSPQARETVSGILSDFRTTLGRWLKAQLILCSVTAAELSAAFFILRLDYAVLLGILIAVIDALPVIGSGTVLIPWALTALIAGNTKRAVVLAVTYAAVTVVRSLLEPRLVGAKIGLPPIAALAAIYVGFCALGVAGMIVFPIALIMIKRLNDRGVIKLWK